jgi:hypothetical protein
MHKNVTFFTIFFTLTLVFFFSACTSNENPVGPQDGYKTITLGKWINTHVNDFEVETDMGFYMEFQRDSVQIYATGITVDENNKSWIENNNYTFRIEGDLIILKGWDTFGKRYDMKFKILQLDAFTLRYTNAEFLIDSVSYPDQSIYTCKRITEDISQNFVGIWYGKSTDPGNPDTDYHYWEYFPDGRYNYYYRNNQGQWIRKSDNEGRYFLYGNYMATNYTNDLISGGTGKAYECWNIFISGNTMKWTGLRPGRKVASYEMRKVDAPPIP